MDFGEIMTYAATALGGGGIAGLLNWRWNKRKAAAETKQDEVEVVRKIIDEILQPTIERQKQELAEVRAENKTLRENYDTLLEKYDTLSAQVKECADSRDDCHKMLAALKEEMSRLQRSRDKRGRYAKEARNGNDQQ